MPPFTRRAFGASLLAAPAITTLSAGPTLAAAHASPATPPALFHAPLGNYRITALFDGMAGLAKGFFSGVDASVVDATLAAAGITGDALPAPVTAFLLQSDDRTILIDAGMGDVDILGPGLGLTVGALAAMGVQPQDVDTIIATHAHPDHIGGLVDANGAVFANAELIISETEVGFWGDAGMMAQAPAEAQGLFQFAQTVFSAYADRTRMVGDGAEVAPGMTLHLAPGHTPGHSVLAIDGGDRQLMMVADAVHNSVLHLALPDIGFGFDIDSGIAAASRRALFDQVSADNMLVAGSHLPFPGFGRIVTSGDAYAYVPTHWM